MEIAKNSALLMVDVQGGRHERLLEYRRRGV